MRYSNTFVKTSKEIPKDEVSLNSQLLIKAGFVDKLMSGVYTYLPLGLRVLSKIEKIVRDEISKIGSEVYMPSLSPIENWQETKRFETVDVLYKASGANTASIEKNNGEYVLNSTHEEIVTPLAQKFGVSYKNFPFAIFQIQTKFRNEARPKSGLLRGREFRMKDLYSFHTDQNDFDKYYENAKDVYFRIFNQLGLGNDTVVALASGGDFTEKFSHEFQTICETGEDELFYDEVKDVYYNKEVAPALAPNLESEDMLERKDVEAEGVIGVEALSKHLKISPKKTTKTLFYLVDDEKFVAVCIRGDYEINEIKLKKILDSTNIKLANDELVMKKTGAETGYAGIINLPEEIDLFIDDSVESMVNFETGTNKTGFHSINVNFDRDVKRPDTFYDFKVAKKGDLNPESGKVYKTVIASEVGNIFPLETKFSDAFKYQYVSDEGKHEKVIMGCYGIGTSRLMGVIAEKFNDENGLVWPMTVSPCHVHLISIVKSEETSNKADKLYEEMLSEGIEVFYDDRDERPGKKFGDADLIGIPLRIVISDRTLESDSVEWKLRNTDSAEEVKLDSLVAKVKDLIN